MKTKDIARQNCFPPDLFDRFLESEGSIQLSGTFSKTIQDADVERAVELYKKHIAEKSVKWREEREKQKEAEKIEYEQREAAKKIERERQEAAEKARREKREALASMLITSGFHFDGFRIVKYSGYISGDDATQIPRSGIFGGDNGQNLTDALVKIRIQAIKELKEAAYDLGCNAVIGVDFDYLTLEPETVNLSGGTLYEPYVICVTANGNAVVIEKE